MKRLINLKVKDVNPDDKKIKKSDLDKLQAAAIKEAINTFKEGLGKTVCKVIREIEGEPQVIVEYADAHVDIAYEQLCRMDVVELIDSMLPKSE